MGKWKSYGKRQSKNLQLVCVGNVHPRVRACCRKFVKWMRKMDAYPVRLVIYLFNQEMITAMDGDKCYGTIFIPDSSKEHPYIRIAAKCCWSNDIDHNDNELAGVLGTIAHELGHYYYWLDHPELTAPADEEEESYADSFSEEMLDCYSWIHRHLA